jgi:integrase
MRVKLTDRLVASLKPGSEPQFDEIVPGLSIDTGARSQTFYFHFTSPATRKRSRILLGHYPSTSLAAARGKATEARALVDEGSDPRQIIASQAGPMTVESLVASYLELRVKGRLRSAAAIERRLRQNVLPIIGRSPVADLHRRDITRVIDALMKRGCQTEACRVFEDARAMLRWAVSRGDLDRNPIEGMVRPAETKARDRALSDAEIYQFWHALPVAFARSKFPKQATQTQRILKLCLVTGQRIGEVCGITADEVDFTRGIWTIPAARSKNKHAHEVPLSGLAVKLIREILADGTRVSPTYVSKNVGLSQGAFGLAQWSSHDLRRTCVSKMAELGVQPIVLGHVINHRGSTKAGVTLGVYVQHNYSREKREALELWAARLAAIVTGDASKIIPLRSVDSTR